MKSSTSLATHLFIDGIETLWEPMSNVHSVAIGVFVRCGSMNETPEDSGISHILEHMAFKGTSIYPEAKQLSMIVQGKGGTLNAYTDRDVTAYYIKCLPSEILRAAKVLRELVLHALLREEDLAIEKGAILSEILGIDDDPSTYIWEKLYSARYPDQAFGMPIIGTKETVEGMTAERVEAYRDRYYHPSNFFISAAGAISLDELQAVVGLFQTNGRPAPSGVLSPIFPQAQACPKEVLIEDSVEQTTFVLAAEGPKENDPDAYAAELADTIFGGPMFSRLFIEVRERRGLVYGINSFAWGNSHHGLVGVYGECDPENYDEVYDIVQRELRNLRSNGLTSEELELALGSRLGKIALSNETSNSRMFYNAQCFIHKGGLISLEDEMANYSAVTLDEVNAYCASYMLDDKTSLIRVIPQDIVTLE